MRYPRLWITDACSLQFYTISLEPLTVFCRLLVLSLTTLVNCVMCNELCPKSNGLYSLFLLEKSDFVLKLGMCIFPSNYSSACSHTCYYSCAICRYDWYEHISASSQCCHGVRSLWQHCDIIVKAMWNICHITVIMSLPHVLIGIYV